MNTLPLSILSRSLAIAATSMLLGAECPGAILLDNHFSGTSRARTNPLEADWRKVASVANLNVENLPAGDSGTASGYLLFTGKATYAAIAGVFAHVDPKTGKSVGQSASLENDGDKLSLDIHFRFVGPTPEGSELRIGLFSDAGTTLVGDTGKNALDDRGYRVDILENGGYGQISRELGGDGTIGSGADSRILHGVTGSRYNPLGGDNHQIQLNLERKAQSVVVTAVLDGNLISGGVDAKDIVTSFEEIGINLGKVKTGGVAITSVRMESVSGPKRSIAFKATMYSAIAMLFSLPVAFFTKMFLTRARF